MKKKPSFLSGQLAASIALILCGLILIIFPGYVEKFMKTVVAAVIMLVGIVYIIQYIRKDVRKDFYRKDLTVGIFAIILGILAFVRGDFIAEAIPTVIGIVILYSGVAKLQNAFDLLRMNTNTWVPVMISAAITITLAVLMIIKPGMFNTMLFVWLGIGLLFGGVTDLLSMIFFTKQVRKMEPGDDSNIID